MHVQYLEYKCVYSVNMHKSMNWFSVKLQWNVFERILSLFFLSLNPPLSCYIPPSQRQCVYYALKAQPIKIYIPKNPSQLKFWRIINSSQFEYIMFVLIMFNTATLAVQVRPLNPLFQHMHLHKMVFTAPCHFSFKSVDTTATVLIEVMMLIGEFNLYCKSSCHPCPWKVQQLSAPCCSKMQM